MFKVLKKRKDINIVSSFKKISLKKLKSKGPGSMNKIG